MDKEQKEMLNKIANRWHRDHVEADLSQAIFDIGYLMGLVTLLESNRARGSRGNGD